MLYRQAKQKLEKTFKATKLHRQHKAMEHLTGKVGGEQNGLNLHRGRTEAREFIPPLPPFYVLVFCLQSSTGGVGKRSESMTVIY